MNNIILTVSYANEAVSLKSYTALNKTTFGMIPVWMVDNRYPMNEKGFGRTIANRFLFRYHSFGVNVGCYQAYNWMIDNLPPDCEKVILYDGDHLPLTDGWAQAAFNVLDDRTVGTCLISNIINQRELRERGYTPADINGHRCKISKEVICSTAGAWNVEFLKSINGITAPHKYYGGNEVEMWKHYGAHGKKLVVLDDYSEDLETMKGLQDWQYEEYKLLYAHRGLGLSFEDYLKTNPQPQGVSNLLKQIFG